MNLIAVLDKKGFKKISVRELNEEETSKMERLGRASGADLSHCLYMGSKYCEGFLKKVKGYRFVTKDDMDEFSKIMERTSLESICVDFYG